MRPRRRLQDRRRLLELRHVTKYCGGLAAAQEVSFSIPCGVIAAVIGPNGAGRTTLFNVISGATAPTQGRAVLNDENITGRRSDQIAARGLVRTFLLGRLLPQMTALGNVLVGFHLHTHGETLAAVLRPRWLRAQEARIREEPSDLLSLVGLKPQADTLAANLAYAISGC